MSDARGIAERLARIAAAAEALGGVAAANLRRDLDGIVQRLEAEAYAETDFVIRDPFDVQRRTHEYVTYVAGWLAQAERLTALLRAAAVEGAAQVVELCPGWAPKTLMALAAVGYRGEVKVIDGSGAALEALRIFSRALQPSLRLEALQGDVFAAPPLATGEVVIANHILDDLLLDRWARAKGCAVHALYEDTALLKEAWAGIASDREVIVGMVLPAIATMLAAHTRPGGRLVLTHYASNVEHALGATEVSQLFSAFFDALVGKLVAAGLAAVSAFAPPAGIQCAVLLKPG